ncbi:hypothetical protein GCM10023184_45450 [Flaviaesturariibacter amylovorans]|uniref:YdhG-like domain-containing protein n=2 Tax=Flaviaesturariibacter amylovorans TaxID=1084520 RepID=A0ABP8HTT4_9BACT
MNRFQPFSFDTLGELTEFLPPDQRKLLERLRALVLECIPDATEKLSYNVPFYSRRTRIVFIWPGAVGWGGTSEGVQLGFCRGNELADDGYLEKGTRKQVYMKTFHRTSDIDADRVRALLFEALDADEAAWRRKRK